MYMIFKIVKVVAFYCVC